MKQKNDTISCTSSLPMRSVFTSLKLIFMFCYFFVFRVEVSISPVELACVQLGK